MFIPLQRLLIVLALSSLSARAITTPEIAASALSPACVKYQVVGRSLKVNGTDYRDTYIMTHECFYMALENSPLKADYKSRLVQADAGAEQGSNNG